MKRHRAYTWAVVSITAIVCLFIGIAAGTVIFPAKSHMLPLHEDFKNKSSIMSSTGPAQASLKNTDFRFTEKIIMRIPYLDAQLIPHIQAGPVNIDDLSTFTVRIISGKAIIHNDVITHIFKDNVFSYEESSTRISSVIFSLYKNSIPSSVITGKIKTGVWTDFKMTCTMAVNRNDNTLELTPVEISSIGGLSLEKVMAGIGLTLDRIMQVPENSGLSVKKNILSIAPFKLMPPPAVEGTIERVTIENGSLAIYFPTEKNTRIMPLRPYAPSYIFLRGGNVHFGRMTMSDSLLQVIPAEITPFFDFYLAEYARTLEQSGKAFIAADGSVIAIMANYCNKK